VQSGRVLELVMPLPPPKPPTHPSLALPSRPGRPPIPRSNASNGPIPTSAKKEDGEIQEDEGDDTPDFGVPAWRSVLNRRQDLGESCAGVGWARNMLMSLG
jgi:hypothetical protein